MEKKFRERVHWAHAARRKKLSWERHVQEREKRERERERQRERMAGGCFARSPDIQTTWPWVCVLSIPG